VVGKKLSERGVLRPLGDKEAARALNEALREQASLIVSVRAENMIAVVVRRADRDAVKLCKHLGFKLTPGASVVFGLSYRDAARVFDQLPAAQREWLETQCRPNETKVLLIAGGTALVSLDVVDGQVIVTRE
jgi:hypothetical protein